MKKFDLEEKFPRIVIVKISNGFLVGIFPENKDLQKLMQGYVKEIMNTIQGGDGEEWKVNIQKTIDKALKGTGNDSVKLYACENELEVMAKIAPVPEGEELKKGNPDLSWFWSEEGHVPD